jgi:hypothetical protein
MNDASIRLTSMVAFANCYALRHSASLSLQFQIPNRHWLVWAVG